MVLCCHSERVAWVPGREPLMSSCVDTELSKRLGGPFTTRWQGSGVELAHLTLNPGDLSCTQTNIYFFLLSFIRSSGFTFLASKTSRLVLKCSFLSDMANCLPLLFLLPTDSDYWLVSISAQKFWISFLPSWRPTRRIFSNGLTWLLAFLVVWHEGERGSGARC